MLRFLLLFVFAGSVQAAPLLLIENTIKIKGMITGDNPELIAEYYKFKDMAQQPIINIYIDSPGGEVEAGFYFVDLMHQYQTKGTKFNCFVNNEAYSMAFIILSACDDRYIWPGTHLLFHQVREYLSGIYLAGELGEMSEILTNHNNHLLGLLLSSGLRASFLFHYFFLEKAFNYQEFSQHAPGWITQIDHISTTRLDLFDD